MLYDYECPMHGEFEEILHLSEMTRYRPCPKCRRESKRVIILGHGGIQGDEISGQSKWIDDAAKALKVQPRNGKGGKFESRTEFKRHCKANDIQEASVGMEVDGRLDAI